MKETFKKNKMKNKYNYFFRQDISENKHATKQNIERDS